jgi:beta-galactosidase
VDASSLPEIPPTASAYQAPAANKTGLLSTRITAGGLTLPHSGSLKVAPAEPRTLLVNLPWTNNAHFESVCTNVMLRRTIGDTDYWVCYGPAGDTGEVTLIRKSLGPPSAQADFTYPAGDVVKEFDFDSFDGHKTRFIVMNTGLTKKTWLANGKLYIGPSFVLEDGSLEFPPEGGVATIYSATGKSEITQAPVSAPALPALSAWSWRDAATERSPGAAVTGWLQSQGPRAMESYDGFQNRYGWYRTTFHRDAAGPVALRFSGQSGAFAVFLNGEPASFNHLDAKAGDNTLAILAKIGPRPKLFGFTGPIGTGAARGLWGGISTDTSPIKPDVTWKHWTTAGNPGNPEDISKADYNDAAWQPIDPGAASQKMQIGEGSSWFRGTFNVTAAQADSSIQAQTFQGGDTSIYLNGKLLGSASQDASGLLVPGTNTILLQVRARKGGSGTLSVALWHNSPLDQATWYFRGGLAGLDETPIIGRVTNWSDFLTGQPWQTGVPAVPGLPTFWKATFTYHHPAGMRETLGLVTGQGLKAGHVWLNGHNLGECPQKVPMYMPECWLKDGHNDLVVFDLYGSNPDKVGINRYEIFSLANPAAKVAGL